MNNYVLYFHRNPITKRIFYVGIGDKDRPNDRSHRSKYWKSYVGKNGSPLIEIHKNALSKQEAIYWELLYISVLGRKRYDPYGQLVNLTTGGEGLNGMKGMANPNYGKPLKEETKKKLAAYAGESHWNRGKKHSPEALGKMSSVKKERHKLRPKTVRSAEWRSSLSKARKGVVFTEEHRKNMSLCRKGKPMKEETRLKLIGKPSWSKGKSLPESTKLKISQARSGKYGNDKNPRAKKVVDTTTGDVYGSAKQAAESVGLNEYYLRAVLNGAIQTNKTNFKYLN